VTVKIWDLGGQERYRAEWFRYTRGCNVIVFIIDSQQPAHLATAKKELHQLLEDRELARIPLLILVNKVDLGSRISEAEAIKGLNLDYISENPWVVMPLSAKCGTNVNEALEFLIKHAR
jgi:Arf/Sar family protein